MTDAEAARQPRRPWQIQVRHLLWLVLAVALVLTLTLQLRLWGAALAVLAAGCGLLARKRWTAELAIALSLGLGALYLLYAPGGRRGPPSTARACRDQLRHIALALAQYRSEHGCLPPLYTQDAQGRPQHSWRALILPYLPGTGAVSGRYRYDEPWDGPSNRRLHAEACPAFRCPEDDALDAAATSYLAVTGASSPWQDPPGDKLAGGGDRLLVVEMAQSAIRWFEPRDLPADALRPAAEAGQASSTALAARHQVRGVSGAFVVFASGEVRFVEADVPWQQLRRWLGQGEGD
ncbi:MAG: DUF1559 domain-containing protein [Pirellulales bacterium]|nr:DUF1559 domain-containing protein [Pirellulales bacterium]